MGHQLHQKLLLPGQFQWPIPQAGLQSVGPLHNLFLRQERLRFQMAVVIPEHDPQFPAFCFQKRNRCIVSRRGLPDQFHRIPL